MPHAAPGRALIRCACAAALLALAAAPAQAIYKWVDEKGVTHFSDDPPPDGSKASKIEPKVTPPSSNAKPRDDWKAKSQEARQKEIERDQKDANDKARAHNESAVRQNRCAQAQRDVQVLESQRPVFTRNDKGEKAYVDDKERASELAASRRTVEANCGSK
jgi:hypothetical protein